VACCALQLRIEADEHDIEADGRDLGAALRQLTATRSALVDAQHELRKQQARVESSAALVGEGSGCQAVALDLHECLEGMQLLQSSIRATSAGAGCALEQELLQETRLRIAELGAENAALQARWASAALISHGPDSACVTAPAAGVNRGAGELVPFRLPSSSSLAESAALLALPAAMSTRACMYLSLHPFTD
jgi:hypothetical protein